VFGIDDFIALLKVEDSNTEFKRTVFIVDITGDTLRTEEILDFSRANPGGGAAGPGLPNILQSPGPGPGDGALTFVFTSTLVPNEVDQLGVFRSDDGSRVLRVLGTISGLNGNVFAEVTATQIVIHHPNSFGENSTSGARPSGCLTIEPGFQDFGEAVLNASNPALATVTRTFRFRNDGSDCITVSNVQNNPPFSLTAASAAQFPITLDRRQEIDIDVVFAPAPGSTGHFSRFLQVTPTPPCGDSGFTCTADAREAEARISTSVPAINFGTIQHPGVATRTFTVSNTGDIDVNITIPPAPAGSDFTWTAVNLQPLLVPPGGVPFEVTVRFNTPGDLPATQRIITVTPTAGDPRTVTLDGAGCIANSVIQVPAITPLNYGQIERGFRTVRFIEITNNGDGDLRFRARITPLGNPTAAALFGLVLLDNDITDAPGNRRYVVLPPRRCGAGSIGVNTVAVAVSFFANSSPGNYTANLVIDNHNADNVPGTQTWTFPLSATIIAPVPVDAVLVLDRSGSMAQLIGQRNKSEAAVAAGHLFIQLLRDSADDRAAIVRFNENPELLQGMLAVQGNRSVFEGIMTTANFIPQGQTNIAGGIIVGTGELTPHPANPPDLKRAMIVLTDGMETSCFQVGGAGPFFSITGRDADDNPPMRRPQGPPQDSEPLPAPTFPMYAVGLGNPEDLDDAVLDAISTATGAYYDDVVELTGRDYFLLEKHFTQIFMATAGVEQILDPFYTINPGEVHEHEFDIFPGDVNAMVVVYDEPGRRLPFFIVSPKEEVLSGTHLPAGFSVRSQSTDTARLVEFFFPQKEPRRYAGRWKVVVRHARRVCSGDINAEEKRGKNEKIGPGFTPRKCTEYNEPVGYGIAIGAGSNLRMQPYIEPGVKYVGEALRLSAVVSEAGLPVKGSNVSVEVETPTRQLFNVILRDDGHSQDGEVNDGEYAGVLTQTAVVGVYKLHFRASGLQAGRPYNREANRTKTVYDKRKPPVIRDGDCCRKLLRVLGRQEVLLRRLVKEADD
jgi:hypothetical protein